MLKPGPGAGKVVYEIEHVAYTCVPRLTVADFQPLTVNKPARLTLFVKNTVEREVRVRVTAVTSSAGQQAANAKPAEESKEAARSGALQPLRGPEVWAALPSAASCDVRLSDEWVWLPAYDEIAEESGILQEQKRPDDIPSDNTNVSLPPDATSTRRSDTTALRLTCVCAALLASMCASWCSVAR